MCCHESAETALWLGETIGFWVQTGAVILSAGAAIAIIFNNSHQAKKRATIDLVLHETDNDNLVKSKHEVAVSHEANVDFTRLSSKENSDDDLNAHILMVLNNHEFVATGIKEGAFDEEIYKRMKRSIVLRDWDALRPYIMEKRRQLQRDKLFVELEWLANRWKNSEIKPEVCWWRRFFNKIGL